MNGTTPHCSIISGRLNSNESRKTQLGSRSILPSQDETRIGEIIASYLAGREAGNEQSQEEFLSRYPEFEKELKDFFENDAFVKGVLSSDDRAPCFGDDYQVLNEIGRGGMGIVYRSHQKSLEKVVAIKTITLGPFATPADIEGMHKEAQRAAGLRHPNIVTVHHVSEHKGQHFFVMEHIEGKNLADLLRDGPLPSTQAAHYVKTIAEAIHYAHQRQILHCDLKPANILLDEEGKPYVVDFGLAKRLGDNARYLPTSAIGGSPGYMAPEQAAQEELTTATDVYGLGAILYALLTGSPPFQAGTLLETLKQVRDEAPQAPSKRSPNVDKDLEAICLKCLDKDKDQRYGSAYGLARDLARYQSGEETTARPWRRRERTIRWCRQNPAVAGLISTVAVISILTVVMAVSIAQARRSAQLQEALQSNSFAARDLARTALLQLQNLSDVAEAAARDPALPGLLARGDQPGLQRYLDRICRAEPITFVSCQALSADGIQLARVGEKGDAGVGTDFSWRDYFRGAKEHRPLRGRSSVHISRVFRSRIDDLFKFAVSAPILSESQGFLGAVTTHLTTDTAMGSVILEDERRKVVLIAPRDTDDPQASSQDRGAVIVFHPGYRRGIEAVEFPGGSPITAGPQPDHEAELEFSKLAIPPVDSYTDPVSSVLADYRGRWIAGSAPVGNTGFMVIVQQRYDEALKLDPSTFRNLLAGSVVAIFLALTIVLILWRSARRSTAPRLDELRFQ